MPVCAANELKPKRRRDNMKNIINSIAVIGMAALVNAAPQQSAPTGKEADMTKPVKVFILLGQSNMVGMGNVTGTKGETLENAVKTEKLYPYLVDAAGNWAERSDVR
jgi:hypothetical protein